MLKKDITHVDHAKNSYYQQIPSIFFVTKTIVAVANFFYRVIYEMDTENDVDTDTENEFDEQH